MWARQCLAMYKSITEIFFDICWIVTFTIVSPIPQPTLFDVLAYLAGSLGFVTHYVIPQLRKEMPWLCCSHPALPSYERPLFEVRGWYHITSILPWPPAQRTTPVLTSHENTSKCPTQSHSAIPCTHTMHVHVFSCSQGDVVWETLCLAAFLWAQLHVPSRLPERCHHLSSADCSAGQVWHLVSVVEWAGSVVDVA